MDINDADDEEFGFSRNYFLAKELGSSGNKSTHRFSDIDVVPEEDLRGAVANLELKHAKEVKALMESYRTLYDKWVFEPRCGFGLLMYGFGFKKVLVDDFASTALVEYPVIVLNGYLQSINIKQVLITVADSSGIK